MTFKTDKNLTKTGSGGFHFEALVTQNLSNRLSTDRLVCIIDYPYQLVCFYRIDNEKGRIDVTVTSLNPVAHELDASGLCCPLPILKTRKAISGLDTGEILRVLSTDRGSLKDIESFCHQTGNDLLSSTENDGSFEFLIRKN